MKQNKTELNVFKQEDAAVVKGTWQLYTKALNNYTPRLHMKALDSSKQRLQMKGHIDNTLNDVKLPQTSLKIQFFI